LCAYLQLKQLLEEVKAQREEPYCPGFLLGSLSPWFMFILFSSTPLVIATGVIDRGETADHHCLECLLVGPGDLLRIFASQILVPTARPRTFYF
jgi:hypothetical protein